MSPHTVVLISFALTAELLFGKFRVPTDAPVNQLNIEAIHVQGGLDGPAEKHTRPAHVRA